MRKFLFVFVAYAIVWNTCSSCKQSILDRSVYEDLTVEEVLSMTETIPSFRFFYDNIRVKILAKSDEFDRETFKGVTYRSLYNLFNYWSSTDYANFLHSAENELSKEMVSYQSQIDSVSEHYRGLVDSVKVTGAPRFDFKKIFELEHQPEIDHNPPYCGFCLAIKNQIGFEMLSSDTSIYRIFFDVVIRYKETGQLDKKIKVFTDFEGDRRTSSYGDLLYIDSAEDCENKYYFDFDAGEGPLLYWRLKSWLPSEVFSYWTAQEESDMYRYLRARTDMINKYVDESFVSWYQSISGIIEDHHLGLFYGEYTLYQKAKKAVPEKSEEFEKMLGKIYPASEWTPAHFHLPIHHPNGNYMNKNYY